uniref:Leukosialin n=1 Tax=Geotrypetes seraphini TaxID=260995 RepID=A0A6P8RFN6_GEOSA|nr:leukosialin [Geotrypetes seraphini]XP_033800306.1 leukosialin [Geotrypetes seraphini]
MMEMLVKNQRAKIVWLVMNFFALWSLSVMGDETTNGIVRKNISTTESNVVRAENSTYPSAGKTGHSGTAAESTTIISLYNSALEPSTVQDLATRDGLDPISTMEIFTKVRAEALEKMHSSVSQALTSDSMMHLSQTSSMALPTETMASSNTAGNITILPKVDRDVPAATSAAFFDKITTGNSLSPVRTGQSITPTSEQLFTSSFSSVMSVSSTKHTNYTKKQEDMVPTPMSVSSSTMNSSTLLTNTTPIARQGINHLYLIIVFVILLLLILGFCFVCVAKKKRRSGSTSFPIKKHKKREDAWAGPVMIPEDNVIPAEDMEEGKDKDQAGKHLTLTTFFGKRKSRQCSVLLEDVTVNVEQPAKEEEKPLVDQEANGQMTSNEKSIEPPTSSTKEHRPESEPQPNGHVLNPTDMIPENKGESSSDLPSPVAMPAPDTDFPLPPSELEMIQDNETDNAC